MKRLVYFFMAMVCLGILAACNGATVYDTYVHTPIAGWEKNDTLSFEVAPLPETGHYQESLGLRITGINLLPALHCFPQDTLFPHQIRKADKLKPVPLLLLQ